MKYYISSMKVKTSIALSEDLIQALNRYAADNRSEFIEKALRSFLAQLVRNEKNVRDVLIINEKADALNSEAEDVLAYQVKL
ncbi:MAG: ribbon-helix-helix domain-containing protein [Candidatus Aminicenantes bacterium]|nr:ribbon-helix-helix domain-containing protein [Candidatus Aminicenantes bacterium]